MRIRVLSRASALAVYQAELVGRALRRTWPRLAIEYLTRESLGDRTPDASLAAAGDKGVFTADLSAALVAAQADIVVHSWKDLPIEGRPDTVVAGTIERADARDVLLIRRDRSDARPARPTILTSSPRRSWQLRSSVAALLPWSVETIDTCEVRGNVPSRLRKLVEGAADGLVVAKAALDRLLESDRGPEIRRALDGCPWMVLPTREFPTAPAQGALAVEVARGRPDVIEIVDAISHEATERACAAERAILRSYGGGCHEAIGATVLVRDYGTITSVRGRTPSGEIDVWKLESSRPMPPKPQRHQYYPRPDEREQATRQSVPVELPRDADALWITRAEALPGAFVAGPSHIVWAAGTRTWRKLAARGVWVNGCADGLGDAESPRVDLLAGRQIPWQRLTHTASGTPDSAATYAVTQPFPADLATRTHFYWTSGSQFLRAMDAYPSIRGAWHASGPGRTARTIAATLGATDRVSIWLDYDAWLTTLQ
jgi:hydroxymethylbilane synthase